MYIRVVAVVLLGLVSSATAEPLRAGGSGSATKLLSILSARFADDPANSALRVIPSLGSSGGLRAMAEGAIDIAVSGRPLNAEEIRQGLRVVATLRTPFVMVTSHDTPNELKSTEIAGIYRAPKAAWADGSPLRVILRPKSDSDTPLLGALFPEMGPALEAARARHDVTVAATDQDNADAAERISGSLAGSSLTQIKTEQRQLRLVPVNGVVPSLASLESGAYPFGKRLYVVLPAQGDTRAEHFVRFLHSPAGEAVLRDAGSLIVADPGKP